MTPWANNHIHSQRDYAMLLDYLFAIRSKMPSSLFRGIQRRNAAKILECSQPPTMAKQRCKV